MGKRRRSVSRGPVRAQALHIVEQPLGGRTCPAPATWENVPPGWKPVYTVPETTDDCPVARPCRHINCTLHLWHVEGRDRQGRRHDGEAPPPAIRAPTSASCSRDLEGKELSADEVGKVMGMGKRRVQQIVKAGLLKLRAMNDEQRSELLDSASEELPRTYAEGCRGVAGTRRKITL